MVFNERIDFDWHRPFGWQIQTLLLHYGNEESTLRNMAYDVIIQNEIS